MKRQLTDPWFEAEFYGNVSVPEGDSHMRQGGTIEGAQGVFLYCPCSYGDDTRAHGLIVPFANPRNAPPVPSSHGPTQRGDPTGPRPRWNMSGTGLSDLTLTPSIDVGDPSCWHGFISGGEVT